MRVGLESHNLHCRCRNVGKSERSVCDLAIVVVNDERNGVERVRRTHGNNAFLVLFKHLVGIAVICRYDECVIVLFDDRKQSCKSKIDRFDAYSRCVEIARMADHIAVG